MKVDLHPDLIDLLICALDWYEDDRAECARYGDEEDEQVLDRVRPQIWAAREILKEAYEKAT